MPFKAQLYSLHQKGTSLSDKAVAPSQFDLILVGRSSTNTTTTSKGSLYPHLYLNILTHCCYLYLLHFVSVFFVLIF